MEKTKFEQWFNEMYDKKKAEDLQGTIEQLDSNPEHMEMLSRMFNQSSGQVKEYINNHFITELA